PLLASGSLSPPGLSMRCLSALAADLGHVLAVAAHFLAALAASVGGLPLVPLVRRAPLVGRSPAPAGHRAALLGVHRGEAALSTFSHDIPPVGHRTFPSKPDAGSLS